MTLEEYINNPIGKTNAVLTVAMRDSIRDTYARKFDNILLRENGKINYYLYENKKANAYYILVKVPSEVVENFYYEVVMKFTANSNVEDLGRNLLKYNVQFYSNDPWFVFTYAHAFIKNNLFIKDTLPRMSKLARSNKPSITNPREDTGYVKSIFFAYLFMKQRGLFNVSQYRGAEPYTKESLLKKIEPADQKIEKRIEEGKKYSKKKKIVVDKQTARNIQSIGISDTARDRLVTTTKKTPTIKKTQAINKTKVIKPKRK